MSEGYESHAGSVYLGFWRSGGGLGGHFDRGMYGRREVCMRSGRSGSRIRSCGHGIPFRCSTRHEGVMSCLPYAITAGP